MSKKAKETINTNSYAIWVDPNDEENPNFRFEIHLNYWLVRKFIRKSLYSFDLGIKLSNLDKEKLLCIYIPSTDIEVSSLGHYFKSENLARAVFNENISLHSDDKNVELRFAEDQERNISIYDFDKKLDLKSEPLHGQVISFNIQELLKKAHNPKNLYLRLRLVGPAVKKLIRLEKRGIIPFESVYSSSQIMDFRLNQFRSLNPSIKEKIKGKIYKFDKVHFFFVVPSADEFQSSFEPINGTRNLESHLWDEYVSESKNQNLFNDPFYTAYHWKRNSHDSKSKIEEFSVYAKFKRTQFGFRSFTVYSMVAILLSMMASYLYSLLNNYLSK
ncbi:hypothetical protein [Leptospira stimsonii]|uniref:Uncharacterized protein n=1 Tax=Leptospira stimsonii TaxID=2202203 RepID=A0ABY2MWB7_9LEPT|nr:hypothetical protein [Leptospira stimsonii]TGK17594.1 hypothetical protein EHO98_13965 [Leptospira stimsonii]TGM10294.1 hypothetical protein EHQ90_19115 [Leptospira stimsonii]